jgi:hypothetical protein
METHTVKVKYYTTQELEKNIEVTAQELLILERNKALSSNIEIEKSVMVKLTGEIYNRRKIQILLISEVKILLSIF